MQDSSFKGLIPLERITIYDKGHGLQGQAYVGDMWHGCRVKADRVGHFVEASCRQ